MIYKYKRLIDYILRQWPVLVLIICATLASTALTVLQPWPLKLLVDYGLGQVALPQSLISLLKSLSISYNPFTIILLAAVCSFGIFVIKSSLDMGLSFGWTAYGQRMVYELAADLFNRLQRLSLLFHKGKRLGDYLNRLEGDTYCIYSFTNNILVSPIQQTITLITIGVIAWKLNKELTLISLVVAPLIAGASLYFGPRFKRRTKLEREARSRLMNFVHQTLASIPVVKAFGTEGRNFREFNRLADESVDLQQRSDILNSSYQLLNNMTTTVGTAIILFVGGKQVLSGTLTLGGLLVFLAYLSTLQGAFKNLMGTYTNQKSLEARIDRVLEIMDARDIIQDAPGARNLQDDSVGVRGHVVFENVTFGYDPDCPVLRGIGLEGLPGKTLALVGPTGAGKSTLVSLIPRFFDPWKGRVLLDGTDIREIKVSSLRSHVAIVLQEPFLLPLSIAENIAYSRPGASLEEIRAAASAANADEFIQKLSQGYDTILGERGATLSGGQMQRLAIARAFLKDAPVLILDEPTSSLDPVTETLLLDSLDHLMEGRTTFIIAHRLSTIRRSDWIIVLEEGRVVEEGTHSELMAEVGLYARLNNLQFQKSPWEKIA